MEPLLTSLKLKGFISDHVEKNFEGTLKIARVVPISSGEKIPQIILEKQNKLKMAVAQSIFKILRSSFLQTPPFS